MQRMAQPGKDLLFLFWCPVRAPLGTAAPRSPLSSGEQEAEREGPYSWWGPSLWALGHQQPVVLFGQSLLIFFQGGELVMLTCFIFGVGPPPTQPWELRATCTFTAKSRAQRNCHKIFLEKVCLSEGL